MNNEMLYKLFLNSLGKMNDEELASALLKAKGMLNDNDYEKLLDVDANNIENMVNLRIIYRCFIPNTSFFMPIELFFLYYQEN